ncbi:MAG TPA: tetratricopeptide repeat protein [Spirochaetota bacterium]|nr:tetratricopeptide repeat protein [Spirochaetota bacterium]
MLNQSMKSVITASLLAFFFPVIMSGFSGKNCAPLNAAIRAYSGEHRTIAHDFLDMESDFGAKKEHYAAVDRLINRAAEKIVPLKTYTTEQAVQTLLALDSLLKEDGYRFGDNFLLSIGLEKKVIDCDNYCTLYIAIAEVLKIPLIPVYAPNHSFLRFFFDDGSYLNWEPIEAVPLQDSFYIKKLGIPQESIRSGVYLKSLERREFIGVEHNNIGAWLMSHGRYADSLSHFGAAIELYPAFSSAYHNRGSSYYALKKIAEAESDLKKAASLDPSRASTRNTLGDVYFDLKEYENALREYTASIKLDPGNYVPYYSIGLLMKAIGEEDQAGKWLRKAEEVKAGSKK